MSEVVNNSIVNTNENTRVSVSLGYTLNLGNFQSLRIDLGVTDSRKDGENIGEAFERVYGFVEDRLADKVKEATSEIEQ
jgi:methyl coenzyme M reductase subunit D